MKNILRISNHNIHVNNNNNIQLIISFQLNSIHVNNLIYIYIFIVSNTRLNLPNLHLFDKASHVLSSKDVDRHRT